MYTPEGIYSGMVPAVLNQGLGNSSQSQHYQLLSRKGEKRFITEEVKLFFPLEPS